MSSFSKLLSNVSRDLPASIVVFLVALPLCLGVAVASDADPFAGITAGIIGGIVIGFLSGSQLSVSGPAAGLAAIVASAISTLGDYEVFLVAVVLAGILQLVFGYFKAGVIGRYIPNAVINGMLAAIGILLILKQLPHFVGYDKDPEGEEAFFQPDGENTFSELIVALNHISPLAILIAITSALILLLFEWKKVKSLSIVRFLPGPLIVVVVGVLMNEYILPDEHMLSLRDEHVVQLPVFSGISEMWFSLPSPKWSEILNYDIWIVAVTIAIVASLESLLSLEASDKLDEEKRISPTNRELMAQGTGNVVSGLLGGLPVTSVIVRSSANVSAGAKSKMSTIFHGTLLLLSILLIPNILNLIPKAALAAILIFTGYKLAKVSLFKEYYKKGWDQFLPFIVTIVAILFTDLLIGIFIGILVGFFSVLKSNFKSALSITQDDNRYLFRFGREVSFLNKPYLMDQLEKIPENSHVLLDAQRSDFIDADIIEIVNDFIAGSHSRGINVYVKRDSSQAKEYFIDPYRLQTI